MKTLEIKSRWTGVVLKTVEIEDGKQINLRGADLCGANLHGADLCDANLCDANLCGANLCGADLCDANLRDANLRGANLHGADLCGANLHGADLCDANLRDANLRDAKNSAYAHAQTIIVPEGRLIVWKKCNGGVLVKLAIPEEAKRSCAAGRKCRAEFAEVLDVIGGKVGITNQHGPETTYRKGETVRCDKWDEDRWNECSGGIHFFLTRIEAENYA